MKEMWYIYSRYLPNDILLKILGNKELKQSTILLKMFKNRKMK